MGRIVFGWEGWWGEDRGVRLFPFLERLEDEARGLLERLMDCIALGMPIDEAASRPRKYEVK